MARAFAAPAALAFFALMNGGALAQQANMSFFVSSTGPATGPISAGSMAPTSSARRWRRRRARARRPGTPISTQATGGATAVNARDRIGKGPWQNAKGVTIAKDVAELHGEKI